jgi:hypothetical protein
MKTLLIIVFPFLIAGIYNKEIPETLSKEDRKFVKNVIKMASDEVENIAHVDEHTVVINFQRSRYKLDLDKGFVKELWILEEDEWIALGPEY